MKSVLFTLIVLCTTAFAQSQSNDPVDTFAHAIAKAEGFGVKHSIPTRYHNPGDIKIVKGWRYPGQKGIGKANHVIFANDAAGWAALRHQIQRILDGDSRHYSVEMNVAQMGRKYAGNSALWSKNVAHNLGVDKSTTLREYFDIPPVLHVAPNPKALEGIL